jgi:hypothetical protein
MAFAGKVWRIRVPEVEAMASDLIAIVEDIPAGSFDLEVTLTLPAAVGAELDQSAELHEQAARSQAQAAQLGRLAARRLPDQGLPPRR